MNNDEQHLKYLFMGHIASGCLLALISMFPVIHVVFGLSMLFGAFDSAGGDAPPREFGIMFAGIGGFLILMFLTWAILNFVAAFSIKGRKRRIFCLVVAGLNCTSMPFGTLLGVFTFIVLLRESVKEMFDGPRLMHDV